MKLLALSIRSSKNRKKTGAAIVEYVMLIAFIAMIALIGIKTFGQTVTNKMGSNNNSVANAIQ